MTYSFVKPERERFARRSRLEQMIALVYWITEGISTHTRLLTITGMDHDTLHRVYKSIIAADIAERIPTGRTRRYLEYEMKPRPKAIKFLQEMDRINKMFNGDLICI